MKPPIKNYIPKKYPEGSVTQWYGENPELYQQVSAHWAIQIKYHNGIDIVAPYGTPILAPSDQTICEVKNTPVGYGRHIRGVDDKYEYTYGHLSLIIVKIGDEVKQGDVIGFMGNSGFVVSGATPYWEYNPYAGTHLHFGIREIDNRTKNCIMYQTGKICIKNYPGDAGGAIDPSPLIESDIEVEKKQKMLTIVSLSNQVISLLKRLISIKKK